MTLELLLLRHAKSSWSDPSTTDHERPLNDRGRRTAPRMGRLTRTLDRLPDLVLSSDARRTRETVDLWRTGAEWDGEIQWSSELYHASAETLAAAAASAGPVRRLMLVAHNPGLEDFATRLAGANVAMPTATLAIFESTVADWSEFASTPCRTVGVWRPRALTDDSADATSTPR